MHSGADMCYTEDSFMFLQVGCLLPDEQVAKRRKSGLFLGSIGVFIALFVINYLDYIKKVSENSYVEWDLKTITAGDYTIEFNIDEAFYDDWVKKELEAWD